MEPPHGAADCAGVVPDRALGLEDAEAIFRRLVHEVGHISEALEQIDETFSEVDDSGYLVGTLTRDHVDSVCATVRFECWTGGHGGFGPSALHGVATVVFGEGKVEVTGNVGLAESGALVGAPYAPVDVTIVGDAAEGAVGAFEL